ncbi:hypothetical protein [Streptomyces sp. NPDC047315]|uniref:hypothetical protein n=1 Tax=Streptomyces sp. NPDC047315 TaxID=3155142 RepID=UPI0033C2DBC0
MGDTDGTRSEGARRRSPWLISLVAAALVAGAGGGAYLVAADSGQGGDAERTGRSHGGDLPKLPVHQTVPPPGTDGAGGGLLELRADADALPKGPAKAPAYRAGAAPTSQDVTALARALGLKDAPRKAAGSWLVGSEENASLRVEPTAPGQWTYSAAGVRKGSDDCGKGLTCGGSVAPPQGITIDPVSEKRAKDAAAPLLKAVGQQGAAVDADETLGASRTVVADPVVGGLPTYGWTTRVEVGADGGVTSASGWLSRPTEGESYPLLSAAAALKQANEQNDAAPAPKDGKKCGPQTQGPPDPADPCGVSACATAVPLAGKRAQGGSAECPPAQFAPPQRLEVRGTVLGLSAVRQPNGADLVPTWLFGVAPEGARKPVSTLPYVAVEPKYLTVAGPAPEASQEPVEQPPKEPRGHSMVQSYRTDRDGRTMTVTFMGGVCTPYTAKAVEKGDQVRVTVTAGPQDSGRVCIQVAKEQTVRVTLDRPLGDREVVDEASGLPVPRG